MKKASRFDYLKAKSQPDGEKAATTSEKPQLLAIQQSSNTATQQPSNPDQRSVPRGQGRMQQSRAQLNVRLPEGLKRRALAKAALEGRLLGEVIEELVSRWLDPPEQTR